MRRLSFALMLLMSSFAAQGAEHRALQDVDVAALSRQLLTMKQGNGLVAVIWWPPEFWSIALAREAGIPEDARKQTLAKLGRYSMMGVVDARMLPAGTFAFESREAVLKNSTIDWSGPKGRQRMVPMASVPEELRPILQALDPMMRATLGELGKNLHILIFQDDAPTGRVMSPYEPGTLTFTMLSGSGSPREVLVIETPADALFIPRLCANGKPAHVTWTHCPWDGVKLSD